MASRCPSVFLVLGLTALALAAPVALAQPVPIGPAVPPFTLQASPGSADVFPNETATFAITVGNPALIDRSAAMALVPQLPAGWTYNFSRDNVSVVANGTNTTLLSIFVGDNPAGVFNITFEADDEYSNASRSYVLVNVKERPASQPQVVAPPSFSLSVSTGDSAQSGEIAHGTLVIRNDDASRPSLSFRVAPIASGGWSPYVCDSVRDRVLPPGASATVPVCVQIPPLSEDASQTLELRVTTDGATKSTPWTVRGTAAPAPAVFDPTQPPSPTPSAGSGASSRRGSGAVGIDGPNLDMYVEPLEISIPSGGEYAAVVHLVNTGTTPLNLALAATPPATWRPFAFSPATPIALGPGDRADVAMTLYAPDVPPGGATNAKVFAIDDSFVRSASFVIHITPGAPVDRSQTTSAQAPAAPEGGVPVAGSTLLVVVGLAAVGGAAAIVASRPLREGALWLGIGLYTRLARPDVLGHEDRERLYRLVETHPGIHFHALQRDLAWNTGTLTYHLRVLERHGFVVSRRDGLYRRFFLAGAAPRKETFENQGPTGLRADVLEAIKNTPGISQTDLALGLGANKQTVNYHVKALERGGTIRVEKRGRDTYLFPVEPASEPGPAQVRA